MKAFLLAISCAFAACATPALAAENAWGDDVQVVQSGELAGLRGGFAVGGYDINFGAVVTTYINGTPALSTSVTWTDAGRVVSETIGALGENIANMTPEQRAALGLGDLNNAQGVVITDASGVTALVHNIADGALQNILINSGNGRDITQNVDVTLELPGFETMQGDISLQRFGMDIAADMAAAALPHG